MSLIQYFYTNFKTLKNETGAVRLVQKEMKYLNFSPRAATHVLPVILFD